MPNHHRSTSIPRARLTQSLPPLPQEDIVPLAPYHDDPADDELEENREEVTGGNEANPSDLGQPPQYEPMHDYLAARVRRLAQMRPPEYELSAGQSSQEDIPLVPQEPYRDEPFVVTIDPDQPPPPSYEMLYVETQTEIERLQQEIDWDANHAEDICKWLVSMLLITLTIVAAGFAFNWGKPW
ncbi:hypothetical protein CJF31_00002585 [Rutstroemia sp. NJR-2017a BVV2]|nr:hypothetical protein CJF31_00002585 [Rutstroemia sp. NJR-2017a BVV2]